MESKLYVVLVTPGASAGVKCRQGSLGVVDVEISTS